MFRILPASVRWAMLGIVAALYTAGGLSRISFDVDILELLPPHLSQVTGLSLFIEHFAQPNELIITLEGRDADELETAAISLAKTLSGHPDLVKRALAEEPWQGDPAGLAELLAFQLLSQPPAKFDELLSRFSPENADGVLDTTLADLAETLSPAEATLRSYDPFGLTSLLPTSLLARQGDASEFRSADGLFHLVHVESATPLTSYRDSIQWVRAIRALTEDWNASHGITLGFTGQPAFVADISGSMDREMSLTGGTAFLLVGAIFWLCYRRIGPLLLLLGGVTLSFLLAMATAGWLLDDLTVISVGFAAVMIGLSVDYGYFVFNRAVHGANSLPDLRRRCLSNIAWTCGTTAAAFFALNLSSLPGLSQLGMLVGFGVVIGAAVMLGLFAPFALRHIQRHPIATPVPLERLVISPRFLGAAAVATGLAAATLLGSLLILGPPKIDFSANTMRPKVSGAYTAMERIYERLADDRGLLSVVVTGDSYGEVADRLKEADRRIDTAVRNGDARSALTASAIWPDPPLQQRNLARAKALAPELPRLRAATLDAGFTESAFALTDAVISRWSEWSSKSPPIWPDSEAGSWMLRRLVRHEDGVLLASGFVHPVPGREEALLDAFGGDGIYLVSWEQLGRQLKRDVPREMAIVTTVLLAAVVCILAVALRSLRGIVFFVLTISLSLACLVGVTSLLGGSVGLFSLAALLLLLGTGTDYTILPLLALRRNGGDAPAAQRELALVILLCAASSAAGFGALGFANNMALAELGRTCALGLVINACVSLFLLPPAWRLANRILPPRNPHKKKAPA